jgi:L-amino acid N-acyltransferase YncA
MGGCSAVVDGLGGIRRLARSDLASVVRICNVAILRGESTQGPEPVTEARMLEQLFEVGPRFEAFAFVEQEQVVAWGALCPHTNRPVYNVSCEVELFVANDYRRRGIARRLMGHLLERASALEYHAILLLLQPTPTPPAAWAIRLGFRSVGMLARVLPVAGEWRDIFVFEKFLSEAAGSPHVS